MLLNPFRFTSTPSASSLRLLVAVGSSPDLYSYKDPFGAMAFVESLDTPGSGISVEWSPSGQYAIFGRNASPYATLYKRVGDVLVKLHDITEPTATLNSVVWGAGSDVAYLGCGAVVYKYARSGDTLTFVSSPGSALAGLLKQSTGLSLSPDGAYLACAHATSPYLTIYRTSDWAKLSSPATLPSSQSNGCAWHPSGTYLAVAHNTSPRVSLYSFASETLTKLSNPAPVPSSNCNGVAWGGSGSYLVLVGATDPFWWLYTFSAGALTNVATSSFSLESTGYGLAALGDKIVCGHSGGKRITLFSFDGATISAGPVPSTVPSFGAIGVSLVEA